MKRFVYTSAVLLANERHDLVSVLLGSRGMLLRGMDGGLCRAVAVVSVTAHLFSAHRRLNIALASMGWRLRSLFILLLLLLLLALLAGSSSGPLLKVRGALIQVRLAAGVHGGWIDNGWK